MSQTPSTASPTQFEQQLLEEVLLLVRTVAALRTPETGCPWDLEQDHRSLRKYMLEEAQEAAEAMGQDCPDHLCEELGDVLLQVVLNARIASEHQHFTFAEVARGIRQKLIRRHPHVFGSEEERKRRSLDQIAARWREIKAEEKAEKEAKKAKDAKKSK